MYIVWEKIQDIYVSFPRIPTKLIIFLYILIHSRISTKFAFYHIFPCKVEETLLYIYVSIFYSYFDGISFELNKKNVLLNVYIFSRVKLKNRCYNYGAHRPLVCLSPFLRDPLLSAQVTEQTVLDNSTHKESHSPHNGFTLFTSH